MRLDWNVVRARAYAFASKYSEATREKSETQSFYNDFFGLFGAARPRAAQFEHPVRLSGGSKGFIDLFWPGKLLVEQKSAGGDLEAAKRQAFSYFEGLKDNELPRYVLVSDFRSFELLDLETSPDDAIRFDLAELPERVQAFGFIVGQEKRVFKDQDPVNIHASELMGALHDALDASGYRGHELERFLVRLLFCLFADDTGIFQPLGSFQSLVLDQTKEDGNDLGPFLNELFQVLDTPDEARMRTLRPALADLPHINGQLFRETLRNPSFDRDMREKLLLACSFDWQKVSPAIFGSLFQSVMDKAERRKKGAHYTSEKNILKVIQPLFLDDLRAEFARLKSRRDGGRAKALEDFHGRLGTLTFLDPACGCGNFLVIAYRELRLLEIEVMRELFPGGQFVTDIGLYAKVNVNQFYGIEIGEFPVRIAEVALWMMDHIMNARLSAEFGQSYLRIPLKTSPNIVHADALETDWAAVLPPERCSFILGNPPFVGAKVQSEAQRAQVIRIAGLGKSGGTLDYVCAWFVKAAAYLRASPGPAPRIGFVATNSITQGEQVAQLWPILFGRYGLEIAFGHRTFQWMSDAKGKAHVHCVIVGLVRREDEPKDKRLFSYEDIQADPVETRHPALTAYLTDAGGLMNRHIVVPETSAPLFGQGRLVTGTQPIDDGHLIIDDEYRAEFLNQDPASARYLRPFIGADEYINGRRRWILDLREVRPDELRNMPLVRLRLRAVRDYRSRSKRKSTRALSEYPTRFNVEVVPSGDFLVIPEVSSESRPYIPIGWISPPVIPSNKLRLLEDADLWDFGILTSQMHMAWMRAITGRMKSDYMYSVGVVYNTFPWPQADDKARSGIRDLAQKVLDARAAFPDATLADLYDPDTMPPDLRKAHRALDIAVDRLYRREPFSSDRERVEHLFGLFEKLTATLFTQPKRSPKKRSKTRQ